VITVQGFETVRYLQHIDRQARIAGCRVSQLISSFVYILVVALATPLMGLGTRSGADRGLLELVQRRAAARLAACPMRCLEPVQRCHGRHGGGRRKPRRDRMGATARATAISAGRGRWRCACRDTGDERDHRGRVPSLRGVLRTPMRGGVTHQQPGTDPCWLRRPGRPDGGDHAPGPTSSISPVSSRGRLSTGHQPRLAAPAAKTPAGRTRPPGLHQVSECLPVRCMMQ
jgi:hypothetical protein